MDQVQTRWNGWGSPGHDDPLVTNEPAWRWLAQAFAMPALLATPRIVKASSPPDCHSASAAFKIR